MREEQSVKGDKGPRYEVMSVGAYHQYATKILSGYLGQMDPSYLSWSTKKIMKRDPVISFGLNFNKAIIANQEWWIDCEDETISQALTENIRPCYGDLIERSLDAYEWGYMPFEKVWMKGPLQIKVKRENGTTWNKTFRDHILIKKFKDLNPELWAPMYDPSTDEYLGLWPTYVADQDSKNIPYYKTFIFTIGKEFGNLSGYSRLNYAYPAFYAWRAIYMFANHYMERKADPYFVGHAPPGEAVDENGAKVKNLRYMVDNMGRMRSGQPLVLPRVFNEISKKEEFAIDVLEAPERGEMFIDYLNYLDILKLRSLWIPEKALISGSGRTGTFAESDVHTEIARSFLERDSKTFVKHVNVYILPQLIRYNFGVKAMRETPATLHVAGFRKTDKVLLGHMIKNIMEAQYEIQEKKITGAHLVDLETLFRDNGLPYQTPQEAVKSGATAESFEEVAKVQDDNRLPGGRTKQPKSTQRVPLMPGK